MTDKQIPYLSEWTEIWRVIDMAYEQLLRHFNVSANTYCVLLLLLNRPEGVEPAKIAEAVLIKRQMVALILNDLDARGWIIRRELKTDHRRKNISLTSAGREFIENMEQVIWDANLHAIREMSDEDQAKYLALSKTFYESFRTNIDSITKQGNN